MAAKATTPNSKTSKKKKSRPGSAALSRVGADAKLATAANRRRAEALLEFIARRMSRIAEDFYEIGKAFKELFDKKLYVALGYRSFEELLSARDLMSATQARKLIQVVSRVPLGTALKLGPEKAFALTKYTDATPEPDTPAFLLESGARVGGTPASEASLRDIDTATRAQRKKSATSPRDAKAIEAERAAKSGRAWLKARGAPKAKVEAVRTKDGPAIRVTLPLAEATALFKRRG